MAETEGVMRARAVAVAMLFGLTSETASREDADLHVEVHLRSLSCSALAFLGGDYEKYEGMFRLAKENLDLFLKLKHGGDKMAASWFEFSDYEIETRDYILGYDYSKALQDAAELIRKQVSVSDERQARKSALAEYSNAECSQIEELIP